MKYRTIVVNVLSTIRWYAWRGWNRTRYYWPQAQTRKRTGARLEAEYAKHGINWHPTKPWWLP